MKNLIKDQENILTIEATPAANETVNILIEKRIKIANGSIQYETVIDKAEMTEFSTQPNFYYYFWTPTEIGTFKITYLKIDDSPTPIETEISNELACVRESNDTSYVETRLGFAFSNPDLVSNDNWGNIITPDELRYVYAFGNDLTAPNYQTITDSTLQWYIDNAVGLIERDLNITLIKRVYEARPIFSETEEEVAEGREAGIDFEWEEPYDFISQQYRNYIFIKLRKRPIISIEKCIMRDVSQGLIVDLKNDQWLKPNYLKGSIQAFPKTGTLAATPFSGQILNAFYRSSINYDYPDAFWISYTAGFETVRHMRKKWPELFDIIGKLSAINLLNDYGDGKVAGIASQSLSLAGISESIGTTMSATSAYYGARILQFTNQLKEWYKKNKNKYSGLLIGTL